MRLTIKIFLSTLLLLLAFSSNALQHDNSETQMSSESGPTSKNAAINARHQQECAKMDGIDITDKVITEKSNDVEDVFVCKLNNKLQAHHSMSVSAETKALTGFFKTPTFILSGYAIFYGSVPKDKELGMGVGSSIPGSSQNCGNNGVCSICARFGQAVGAYSLSRTCTATYGGRIGTLTHATVCHNSSCSPFEELSRDESYVTLPDNNSYATPAKNIGQTEQVIGCDLPSSYVGNPISMAIGNKYQHEIDINGGGAYPLSFEKSYNSIDGLWRHNYSTRLEDLDIPMITLVMADGREARFYNESGVIKPSLTELGDLKKVSDGYQYTSPFHEIYDFDSSGRLTRTISSGGLVHNIEHVSNTELVVSDAFSNSLTITETKDHQPLSVRSSGGITVNYEYDSADRLVKVTRNGKSRIYHYADNRFPQALTGITDENGVLYVSWTYDAKGRANSSLYIGDNNKVQITYNSDTQTTVTNPLNRTSVYTYKIIDGVKRITKIQGNATSNCPVIGSTYEYNDHGLLTLKTDGRGIKTKYQYNDLGEETSRTEGFGTPEAKTTTTTWDSTLHRPTTVTTADRVIKYSYDSQGRMTNKTIQTLN